MEGLRGAGRAGISLEFTVQKLKFHRDLLLNWMMELVTPDKSLGMVCG